MAGADKYVRPIRFLAVIRVPYPVHSVVVREVHVETHGVDVPAPECQPGVQQAATIVRRGMSGIDEPLVFPPAEMEHNIVSRIANANVSSGGK
jgi:hypothetical protein